MTKGNEWAQVQWQRRQTARRRVFLLGLSGSVLDRKVDTLSAAPTLAAVGQWHVNGDDDSSAPREVRGRATEENTEESTGTAAQGGHVGPQFVLPRRPRPAE